MEINDDWADKRRLPERLPPKEDRLWAHPSEYKGPVKGHGRFWAGVVASFGLVLIGLIGAHTVWPTDHNDLGTKFSQPLAIGVSTSNQIETLAHSIVKISVPGRPNNNTDGLAISSAGYILVPANSLIPAKSYTASIWGLGNLTAKFVAQDTSTDTALLQVSQRLSNFISGISHSEPSTGEMVIAIGPATVKNPRPMLAISRIQTTGISQLLPGGQNTVGAYLTDAAQKTNPEGMLFVNSLGKPLGLGLYSLNKGWIVSPLSSMLRSANRIELSNGMPKGWLGIVGASTANSSATTSISQSQGVYVFSVTPQSPAYKSGILPRDEIIAVNKQSVSSLRQLQYDLSQLPSGTRVTLTILRNGQARQINTMLGVKSAS